jgi:uncharacterized protein
MINTKFQVGGETLDGLEFSDESENPSLLLVHGAGQSVKERTNYLSERLLKRGIGSFAFDHSGHGGSTGNLNESSLEKRIQEAIEAAKFLDNNKPITVSGGSMGGYISLKLLDYLNVQSLILFCPAIYDEVAYKLQFNENFTKAIRREESWRDSDVLRSLEKFTGNLLVIIGEDDEVIPEGVIELLDKHSINTKRKEIIKIPNCSHQIHRWLSEHTEEANRITDKMIEYITPIQLSQEVC